MGKTLDLTGQRFGRLVAVEKTGKRSGSNIIWKCVCDCGNECCISANNLRREVTKSCGCYKSENSSMMIKKYTKDFKVKNFISGTNLCLINKKNPNKNNKSGIRGVYFNKSKKAWWAHIEFKQKQYYLGSFKNISDAAAARKKAEENLFGNFLKWYEEYKKSGESDAN